MIELLSNLGTLVSMILQVITKPNNAASSEHLTILDFLFNTRGYNSAYYDFRYILLLTFGIMLVGVSVGILKRFLCRN